ncbi:MAG: hypothetical protein M1833_003732 [Piccolia ochrophora]|nr:MAG: hypothetical protein M1833_003732 [Piccolia ochrophora]
MLKLWEILAVGAAALAHGATGSRLVSRQESFTNYINATRDDDSKVSLQITTQSGERNVTAPDLYGLFFEDISHSIDGGVYGELIQNRAFQGSGVKFGSIDGIPYQSIISSENPYVPFGPVLKSWRPIGDVKLSLDILHPLSEALPTVMQIDIPNNATGEVGFLNEGWWGMDVRPQTYNASFYILPNPLRNSSNLTHVDVSLRSNLTDDVWVTESIPLGNLSYFDYTKLHAQLEPTVQAPNSNNTFAVTFDASEVRGCTFYVSLISLFGETYKGRPNGLRKDLAEHIKEMNPAFLRWPGGNNLEGLSIASRFKWRQTLGDIRDRPGRVGTWDYYNTDGLGLLEFLHWCEDMEIKPLLTVYAGYSLNLAGGNWSVSYPEDRMGEVLQEALDELEYVTGNTSTRYGALRAQHGHPEPFDLEIVEIGNEDFFSYTYPYRFRILYDGLKEAHPNITFISSQYDENSNITIELPPGEMYDAHDYREPKWFLENFGRWDNWQEETNNSDITVFLGEYSVFGIDEPDQLVNFSNPLEEHIFFPRIVSAVAEGTYAIGAERNPNTVRLQSYAPAIANLNDFDWSPNFLTFSADPSQTILSVTYWQQWLFAHFRGTQTLPVANSEGDFNPLFWVATIDEPLNAVYLKVVNAGNLTVPLDVDLDSPYNNVNGTILTGELNDYNYKNNQTAVVPRPVNYTGETSNSDGVFSWEVPPYSLTVLQFDL